jgi:hypothetical protein
MKFGAVAIAYALNDLQRYAILSSCELLDWNAGPDEDRSTVAELLDAGHEALPWPDDEIESFVGSLAPDTFGGVQPGATYAMIALRLLGEPLTVPSVRDLLRRAGLPQGH